VFVIWYGCYQSVYHNLKLGPCIDQLWCFLLRTSHKYEMGISYHQVKPVSQLQTQRGDLERLAPDQDPAVSDGKFFQVVLENVGLEHFPDG